MRLVLVILSLSLSGCASLAIQDNDSTGKKAGKVLTRAVIALPTFFYSEIAIDNAVEEKRTKEYLADLDYCIRHEMQQARILARAGETALAEAALSRHDRCANDRRDYYNRLAEWERQRAALLGAYILSRQGQRSSGATTSYPRTHTFCNSTIVMNGNFGTVSTNCY